MQFRRLFTIFVQFDLKQRSREVTAFGKSFKKYLLPIKEAWGIYSLSFVKVISSTSRVSSSSYEYSKPCLASAVGWSAPNSGGGFEPRAIIITATPLVRHINRFRIRKIAAVWHLQASLLHCCIMSMEDLWFIIIVVQKHSFVDFRFSWLYNLSVVNPRHSKYFKLTRLMGYDFGDKLNRSWTPEGDSLIRYNHSLLKLGMMLPST